MRNCFPVLQRALRSSNLTFVSGPLGDVDSDHVGSGGDLGGLPAGHGHAVAARGEGVDARVLVVNSVLGPKTIGGSLKKRNE